MPTRGASDPYAIIRNLYHFTDARNLASIREHGAILSLELLQAGNVNVSAPGGDEASQATDLSNMMHSFVHLCLHNPHPMAFSAKQKGRLGDVVYLRIDRAVLNEDGVRFVPGMSNTTGIQNYSLPEAAAQGMLNDIETLYTWISWRIFPEARSRRERAEKFEILVPNLILIEKILDMPNG